MIVTDNGKTYLILPPPAAQVMRKLNMIVHTKTKVPTDVRRKRNVAHERASEMWAHPFRYQSPIGGLAELVRGEDMPVPAHIKAANRAAFRRRNAESVAAATRYEQYKPKGSDRYFPHQGPREIARRARQMDYGILKRRGYREEFVTVNVSKTVAPDPVLPQSIVDEMVAAEITLGAVGDGIADDTAAVQQHLSASMMSHAMLVEAAEAHVAKSHGIDVEHSDTLDWSKPYNELDASGKPHVISEDPFGSEVDCKGVSSDEVMPELKHEVALAKRRARDRAHRAKLAAEKESNT